MNKPTFFIFLDGFGFMSLSRKYSPTLCELAELGIAKETMPVAGFCQRTPMLTGAYPETSGHFAKYFLNPRGSPFRWFSFGTRWGSARIKTPLHALRIASNEVIRITSRMITGKLDPNPSYIPFGFLPFFDIIDNQVHIEKELGDLPNVFSLCRNYGRSYGYLFPSAIPSKSNVTSFEKLLRLLMKKQRCDFFMLHNVLLDYIGHKRMTDSLHYREALKWIDEQIGLVLNSLQKNFRSFNLVIASDHGMVDVKGQIDVLGALSKTSHRVFKDYLYFLDSTVARFWFANAKAKEDIVNLISNLSHGHILTEEEKDSLKMNFSHRKYGDVFFWTDAKYIICPNFFQWRYRSPKGMHGYLVETGPQNGVLIAYSSDHNISKVETNGPAPLVDVFPTLLTMMKLQIPRTCEGKSLVEVN